MDLLDQVKTVTREQVTTAMLSLLSQVSPETFMKLSVLTKIKDDLDDYGRRIRALEEVVWASEKAAYGYGDHLRVVGSQM